MVVMSVKCWLFFSEVKKQKTWMVHTDGRRRRSRVDGAAPDPPRIPVAADDDIPDTM